MAEADLVSEAAAIITEIFFFRQRSDARCILGFAQAVVMWHTGFLFVVREAVHA
jgi:hypothetical protein